MHKENFNICWSTYFPEAYPISYELKWVYPNRWFRMHSLPESKRYAETEEEYQIILQRQNQLISDLIGEGEKIVLLLGVYRYANELITYKIINKFGEFYWVKTLELHLLRPEEHEEECYYDIYIQENNWSQNQFNTLLKAIADDQIRILIIYPKLKRIISPYAGGMDLILESAEKRDEYKQIYNDWLSKHPKGL